ncbi:MAG: C4-type zinc ribbon domain-containing protein [Candidatus Scalindua sp.]|jgi:predicted  nucleic acid-binding Zn-ribbon protein|nr:C4-type zinc ribbon domain-containing protein [Candidatus Scalindua sp.]
MIESIEVLKRLQSLKSKINELKEYQELRKQDVQKKKTQIEDKKALAEEKHEEKLSRQKEIDRKELDLKTDEGEITKYNVQLNSIKTNKEYTALCTEIGSKKADMSILEDEILSTMSKLESVSEEYNKLQEDLRREEENLKDLVESVDADVKETDIEIEKIQNDQKKYIDALDENSLKHYNRLSSIKGGKAVVAVLDNMCGGCSMKITAQTLNSLMGGSELVFCQSCSRILYLEEK